MERSSYCVIAAVDTFVKIEKTEEEVERLSEELARQVMGLTEEEMAEYVKATS